MAAWALLAALKVMIIAGGAEPAENYHSHFVHVQRLLHLLEERGVPPTDVSVFWADGLDKTADRVIEREPPDPRSWLIYGTGLDEPTQPAPEILNTTFDAPWIPKPAKRKAIQDWLKTAGPRLGVGDTLLIAVTDHGEADPNHGTNTRINLWGETWSTEQMLADLSPVPAEARIVLWMSQCYSGGFAELHRKRANLCGVFSAAPDRPAYGCYPQLAAREDVGHFMRMAAALGRNGNVAHAHDEVLLTDNTPDTPHLTSDAFLYDALAQTAAKSGTSIERFIDGLLAGADSTDPLWRTVSKLSARFGLGTTRSYKKTLDKLDAINSLGYALDTWRERWTTVFDQARERLAGPLIGRMGKPRSERAKAKKRMDLINKMEAAVLARPALRSRLLKLKAKVETSFELTDRLGMQEAAAERAAYLLARLASKGALPIDARTRYAELRACELAPLWAPKFDLNASPTPPPLPGLHRAHLEVEALRPAYLGVHFRDRPEGRGVVVERLMPGGPAIGSDLKVGDVIDSIGGVAIDTLGAFTESVMLLEASNGLVPVVATRGSEEQLTVSLSPAALPLPPRPPRLGDPLPPLGLTPYDRAVGLPGLIGGKPLTLFFWATWCKPCKRALPALEKWAQENGSIVLSITRESPADVRGFVESLGPRSKHGIDHWPFPIAFDTEREGTRLFGVDQLPVFVQVDRDGRVTEVAEGFKGEIPLAPLED